MFKIISLVLTYFCLSNLAYAGAAVSCANAPYDSYESGVDYGDAPSSYGVACHDTDRWQNLGKNAHVTNGSNSWDVDTFAESQIVDSDNSTDDGVTWRTSSDNGTTWSDWTATGELTQGDKVEFKFEVTRSVDGTHEFDELKAWVDWNKSGNWDESEVLINEQWFLNENDDGVVTTGKNNSTNNGVLNTDLTNQKYNAAVNGRSLPDWKKNRIYNKSKIYNNKDTDRTYIQTFDIPLDATTGDIWLRARIVCENSLTSHSDGMLLTATGWHHQGEVEDYKITIAKKTVVHVPEPSSLIIFAAGLFAIAARRKKINVK